MIGDEMAVRMYKWKANGGWMAPCLVTVSGLHGRIYVKFIIFTKYLGYILYTMLSYGSISYLIINYYEDWWLQRVCEASPLTSYI